MDTLLEFITFTKGIEYLIAIAFIFAFVGFWLIVYGKGKRRFITIGVISWIVIAFAVLLGSCVASAPD
jgi:hypothetical protein